MRMGTAGRRGVYSRRSRARRAAECIAVSGGSLGREIAEQLLIDSKGGIDGLLNEVNPIGPKRFGKMPNQPHMR